MSSNILIFSHGVWMRSLSIRAHFKAPDVGAIFLHNPLSIYTRMRKKMCYYTVCISPSIFPANRQILFPDLTELLSKEVFTRFQLFFKMLLQQAEVVAEDLSNLLSLKKGPDDS